MNNNIKKQRLLTLLFLPYLQTFLFDLLYKIVRKNIFLHMPISTEQDIHLNSTYSIPLMPGDNVMNRMNAFKNIVATLALSTLAFSSNAEPLRVSTIDWCPQICPEGKLPGYVIETAQKIFKDSPYELSTKDFPWTRAIKLVEDGENHALLSPAKAEAPKLLFPKHEIGIQRMCFFTQKESSWQYTGLASLKGLKIGVANDTSIEELNEYMNNNKKQFGVLPYNNTYIKKSIKKLEANRIDTFIFTYNSTVYEMHERGVFNKYRSAGCVSVAKIYMAFTPDTSKTASVEKMMQYFDSKMEALKKSGDIKTIMKRYGLEDWQTFL